MKTLVITINGPFAYLPEPKTIRLMAPVCPQHLCVISSIEPGSQFVIDRYNRRNHRPDLKDCDKHDYELRFKHKVHTPPKPDATFLPCKPPYDEFDAMQWRFWLTLPWPNKIVPVDPVKAQIIKEEEEPTNGSYAIGARFIYANWKGKFIPLFYKNKPKRRNNSDVVFKFGNYDDHAYLDIDFSSPLRDDLDHEDAVSCFEHLMSVLQLPWSIYIPHTTSEGPWESSKLNDCRAAVAWIG